MTFGHFEAETGRASPFPSWATERKEREDRARVPGPVSVTAPDTQGPCSGPPVAKSLVYGPGPGSSWGDRASSPTRFNIYSRGSTHLSAAQDLQGLSRAQPAHAGHRHSQSAPLPFLPGRALSSVCDGPELCHRQTDVVNLYIRFCVCVWAHRTVSICRVSKNLQRRNYRENESRGISWKTESPTMNVSERMTLFFRWSKRCLATRRGRQSDDDDGWELEKKGKKEAPLFASQFQVLQWEVLFWCHSSCCKLKLCFFPSYMNCRLDGSSSSSSCTSLLLLLLLHCCEPELSLDCEEAGTNCTWEAYSSWYAMADTSKPGWRRRRSSSSSSREREVKPWTEKRNLQQRDYYM